MDDPLSVFDKDLFEYLRDKLLELGFKKVYYNLSGYRKTSLKYTSDDEYNSYTLKYPLDMEATCESIKNKLDVDVELNDDEITFDNVSINSNGKVSIDKREDFNKKFNMILPLIKRRI